MIHSFLVSLPHSTSVNSWAQPAKLLQLCPTLCGPTDCSPPGSSVHGILHARILVWAAMPTFRGIFLIQEKILCLLH